MDSLCRFSKIIFSDKTIPAIKDTDVFVCTVINEGDLDSKAGDEITVWYMSCDAGEWASGAVYSLRKNKWVTLTSLSDFGFNKDVDYVKKDAKHKGQIVVRTRKGLASEPLETKYVKVD